jgi:hypothetical protein
VDVHVANKEALLDGVVDTVLEEIEIELGGFATNADADTWRSVLRDRILTARRVMLRHRCALGFNQELFQPAPGDMTAVSAVEKMALELPNIVGMLAEIAHDDPDSTLGWCDDQAEFESGLDVLLDGLERRLGD